MPGRGQNYTRAARISRLFRRGVYMGNLHHARWQILQRIPRLDHIHAIFPEGEIISFVDVEVKLWTALFLHGNLERKEMDARILTSVFFTDHCGARFYTNYRDTCLRVSYRGIHLRRRGFWIHTPHQESQGQTRRHSRSPSSPAWPMIPRRLLAPCQQHLIHAADCIKNSFLFYHTKIPSCSR